MNRILLLSTAGVVVLGMSAARAQNVVGALGGTGVPAAVTSGAAKGATALQPAAIGVSIAPLASPALTGAPTAPTQNATDTSTDLATDAFVANAVAQVQAAGGGVTAAQSTRISNALQNGNNLSDVSAPATALSNIGGAPLASPTFTGSPTAATQPAGDNSTTLATDAFVARAASALLVSPAFTGTPTAPTAACTVNGTQLATTAYVQSCAPASTSSGGAGPGDTAITTQSTTYTFASSDCNTSILDTGTTAHNYVVPTGLPLKCSIHVLQKGLSSNSSTPGLLTAVAGSGETLQAYAGQSSTAGQFAWLDIYVDTASSFVVSGNR